MAEKKSRWGRTAAMGFHPFKCESDEAGICATLHAVASFPFHESEMGAVGLQEGEETRSCADLNTVCSMP